MCNSFNPGRTSITKLNRAKAVLAALAFSIIATSVQSGLCTTLRAMSLERLVASSDAVVLGHLVEKRTERGTNGRIVTLVTYEVEQHVVGQGPAKLTVQLLGGTLGGITQYVHGEAHLPPGETTLLFLERASPTNDSVFFVTGMSQGVFRVLTNDSISARYVAREQRSLNLKDAPTDDSLGIARNNISTFIPLESLLALIHKLVGQNP